MDIINNEKQSVRLITGNIIECGDNKIVGTCHNSLHPGKLTKKLMDQHECLAKACFYFEKNPSCSYWQAIERNKRKKLEEKQKVKEELCFLQSIKEYLQQSVNDLSYSMDIIQVELVRKNTFKIFYVSDNPFADGNRFPEFLNKVATEQPSWRLQLRHIKDTDGSFVTREYFRSIRKNNLTR